MIEGPEAITSVALGWALDAASLRHQLIAANIANANTAGYVPMQASFEMQLDTIRQQAGRIDVSNAVEMKVEPRLDASGLPAKIQLDMEMANLTQNAVQYQALVKGLSKHYAILLSAVSDGKK